MASNDEKLGGVYDAIETGNVKEIGEAGARVQAMFEAGLASEMVRARSLATAHDNRVAVLAERSLSEAVNRQQTSATEAASALSKINQSDVPALLAQLVAVLGAGQQSVKAAQSTPPETATG